MDLRWRSDFNGVLLLAQLGNQFQLGRKKIIQKLPPEPLMADPPPPPPAPVRVQSLEAKGNRVVGGDSDWINGGFLEIHNFLNFLNGFFFFFFYGGVHPPVNPPAYSRELKGEILGF